MAYKPVDTAIIMVVGPCIDDTDFKSLEESIAYNAAGMDVSLIIEKTDGTSTATAITLTTGGTSDWTHKDGGYYEIEITAAQNAEEGIAYLRGVCTGVLPFESPRYNIVKANIYDSWIKGTDQLQVDITQLLGTAWLAPGVAGTPDVNTKQLGGTAQTGRDVGASVLLSTGTGAGQLDFTSGIVKSNLTQILAHLLAQTGTQLADGFEKFFDVGTPTGTVNSLPAGAADAAGGLPISDAGGLDLDTKLANTNEITAARMGALTDWIDGGRLDLILDIIAADTTTDIPAKLLKYVQLLARSDAAIATDNATELTAINADGGSGGGDFSNQTEAIEALRDRGDAEWTTATGFATPTNITAGTITTVTNLTNAPTNGDLTATMKASMNTEADTALSDIHLDHLLAADYDPASKPGAATALLNELVENDGGVPRYTANALEQAPSGGTNPNVLIDTTIATLASQTSFTLTAGSSDDDAYKDQAIVLYDASSSDFPSVRVCSTYTGATKTVTLDSAPDFTAVVGDGTKVFVTAPGTSAPTAAQNADAVWDELKADHTTADSFGDYLDADISSRAPASEYDEELEDLRTVLGDGGDIFYVSKAGDNSDGTTWAKAKNTIDAAIALCTANHCDKIYVGCGTYDETSATAGVSCDVAGIKIIGVTPGVDVKNTNTTNGSKVFYITADDVWLHNMSIEKGETTSDNAICIDVNGSYISADIRDVTIAVEKSTHTGIRFTGGAVGSGYVNGPMKLSYIYSAAGVGTGIEAANCNNCVAIDAQFHTLTTGIKFTGGASCHNNMVSPYAMISSCTTGISLTAGCYNNMLSALILNCTTNYADNSGVDSNKADGSLTFVLDDIKSSIVEASPQIHLATASSAVTYGTVDSGTYADTNTDNDTYWQISPDAVNALDMHSQFLIGVGRIPSAVDFNGRFQGHLSRYCEVDAWNYDTSSWETVSSDSNRIGHATADFDRQFALTPSHVKAIDGEMKIRIRSTSITTGDDLYIDKLIIASVAQAAGGLTADAVATTVWNRDVDTFVGAQTAGSRLRRTVAVGTEVSVSNTATSFTVASGKTSANAYRGMEIRIGCSTEDYCETRRIVNWTAGRVVTLDRALSNIPQVGDLVRIMNQYSEVNTTAIEGADPTDTINAACDTALTDYDPPTRAEATTDKDAIITEVNANETKIDTMQSNVTNILTDTGTTIPGTITTLQADSTAIKAKTDNLPSGITKNVALSDFNFYMVLSSDHVTEATGKTVAGTISKDGGAFAALTNAIAEIASGMYKVDLTQAEMNANIVSLKFTETDCDQRIITIYTS